MSMFMMGELYLTIQVAFRPVGRSPQTALHLIV